MADPDDIHGFDKKYDGVIKRLDNAQISDRNKELIREFVRDSRKSGNRKSTCAGNVNIALQMVEFYEKDLDTVMEDDFDRLIGSLEVKGKCDLNYRKITKKFFKWLTDDEVPKWVRQIKLVNKDTPVQPSDLLQRVDLDRLLNSCEHPRDKALIAVSLDSLLRIGALGTLRIKGVESNQHGALLYLSPTSRNLKTTKPKPVPITWSTGFLNQWLSIHPLNDDPEAPLWVNLKGPHKYEAMSYAKLRMILIKVVERAGVKKRVFFHLFRHQGVSDMMLKGFNEQQIKFQAGWTPDSNRMLKIYGNFGNSDMVKSIYAKHGLTTEDTKPVTLEKCPRCHAILVPAARVCHQCALILDAGLGKEVQSAEDLAQKVLLEIMENPELMERFKEKLTNNLASKQ
jgi:integrase/recombinase XerD